MAAAAPSSPAIASDFGPEDYFPILCALSVENSSGFGAPVPVEPRNYFSPLGNVTLRALARNSV